jgi:hypothetical protein
LAVGRAYAGLLGSLAFLTAIGHGLVHAAATEETLWWATLGLFGFAAIGYVAGELAGWIVHDSVRATLVAEVARQQANAANAKGAKKP